MADRRRLQPVALVVLPLLAVAGALTTIFADHDKGVQPLLRVRDEVAQIQERVAALEAERDRLRARARGLKADPFEVETVARENLGMIRPGEQVVRLAPLEEGDRPDKHEGLRRSEGRVDVPRSGR